MEKSTQTIRCTVVNFSPFTLSDCDHNNDQAVVDHLIDKAITNRSQLDLVAIGHISQLVSLDSRAFNALFQLLCKL